MPRLSDSERRSHRAVTTGLGKGGTVAGFFAVQKELLASAANLEVRGRAAKKKGDVEQGEELLAQARFKRSAANGMKPGGDAITRGASPKK